MEREDIIARQQQRKSEKAQMPQRTLVGEYVHYWYILLITLATCYAGYSFEVLLFNFITMSGLSAFVAALIAIFLGGLFSTLPFCILNIVLAAKRKKYYAIAVQVVVMELIGMFFFVYSRFTIAGL